MLRPLLFFLAAARLQALTISELLPENEGGLQDADQASPGWIELHNESATAVSLGGWTLTDDPLLPGKWAFPSQSMASGARLVVFASGKNRAVAGAELHTNFQLDPGGEYLALVAPDGVTKASEFAPFPKLRRNVSYTVAAAAPVTTPVLAEGQVVRWHVPADGSLGTTWTTPAFNDSGWNSGASGLGYDVSPVIAAIDIKTAASAASIPSPAGWSSFAFTTVPESGIGPTTATVSVGGYSVRFDAVGTTLSARNRQGTGTDILNGSSLNNVAEDFIFAATSNYTAGVPRGMDVTIGGLTPGAFYPVTLWSYDRASVGVRSAVWTNPTSGAAATMTFNGSDAQLADDAAFNLRTIIINAQANISGQIILQGRAAATGSTTSHNTFINAIRIGAPSYSGFIATNVSLSFGGTASSLYTRTAFSLPGTAAYSQARLRVRYDDAFAAYLNGTLIASRNAPGPPLLWNHAAMTDRAKEDGLTQEEIVVNLPPGLVVTGGNVIAFHGLTQGSGDPDFLLAPTVELLGTLPPGAAYYATPTPGAVNATAYQGLVRDTSFTVDRQYFNSSVTTAIGCPTPGAQIRYTLNGAAPTASTGSVYSGPLTFTATSILRAAAFFPGWIPSNADTHSYLNMATISAQPANPAGWPANWGTNAQVDTNDGAGTGIIPGNYAMDQSVITTTTPGYSIEDALMAVPTLSLVMPPADFLGPNGIYQNPTTRGAAWERDASIELIDPTGAERGFGEGVRVEIHGNSSRTPYRMQKHSLRLTWKGGNGSAASKLNYRFFPGSRQSEHNKLLLRATFTDGWGLVSWNSNRYRPDDSTMTRDVWVRRSWADMGYLSSKTRYVHLVINGLYWGVYDACEVLAEDFVAENLGGLSSDYYVWDLGTDWTDISVGVTDPFETMFNSGTSLAAATLAPDIETHYQAILQHLDPINFADYYLLHQYAEAEDWPHHNGNAYQNRLVAGSKIKWLPWDQEIALQQTGSSNGHNIDRISPGAANTTTARSPGVLWQALRKVPAWRLLVADRANFLFHHNGPLSCPRNQARWTAIAGELDKPIVAESARWGDTATETPYGGDDLVAIGGGTPAELLARKRSRAGVPLKNPYLRSPDWLNAINYTTNTWIPDLHNRAQSFAIISRLAAQNPTFWPAVEPPTYAQHGGNVARGYDLAMTTPTASASIYYTINGSDPRTGTLYTGPVDLAATAVVKSRAVTGVVGSGTEVWSALTEAQFIVGSAAASNNLAITELHYNPPGTGTGEFLELMNISTGPVDLTGVRFTAGVDYAFPFGTLLSPGARIVLAADPVGFASIYPGVTLHGTYAGKLDNSGELIALTDSSGADIRRFTYNDKLPWPTAPDGGGRSLSLIAPLTNPDHASPENWRASLIGGGTPGTTDADPFTGTPGADTNGDGLSDLLEYAIRELTPAPGGGVSLQRYLVADDARIIVESSADLGTWFPAVLTATTVPDGQDVTETWLPSGPAGTPRTYMRARVIRR